jgi:hypothetical protein
MAAQQELRVALNCIGFNEAAQLVVAMQGFTNITLLGLVTRNQIKQVCKLIQEDADDPVPINIIQQQMLLTMHHWTVNCQHLGLTVSATDFTDSLVLKRPL